jgi:fibronectin type 3 domain-containing protein
MMFLPMRKLVFLALMLLALPCKAQVQLSWFNYPGGVSVATDFSNNVYTANWDYNSGGDITLTKRDAAGNIVWNASYNNNDLTRHEVATWVETDGTGNILVSGTIRSGYSNPVNAASLLMKYSPSGILLWRVVYESSFDGSSTTKCIVDANNNIYVLGLGTGPGGQVTKVKKFNSSGTSIWNYFDSGIGAPVTFKFTPDNNIVIIHRGITGSINGYSKIDLNGNKIWSMAGVSSLSIGDAAGDAFGNTYIINGANPGSILKKLSPAGVVIWSQTNTMNGNKVEVGTDNNPMVGGYPVSGYGVALMKYDSNGSLLWQNLDADGASLSLLALAPMKLDGSNAAYIAGSTMSQMGICKVNSDGSPAWAATTSSGYPVWFEFGTDNSIYIVGGTTARFTQSGTVPSTPTAPSNLVATSAGISSIKLTWSDNSTNETSFVLMQSSTSGGIFNKLITIPANTTSYTDVGLGSSSTYYYKIQATNAGGNSAWSNEANAATASSGPPAAPSGLTAIPMGCNSVLLTWTDKSTNEVSFDLRRSTSSNGTYSSIAVLPANTTTYTNTGLTKGRKYYYKIRAVNSAGNSAWSTSAFATATCSTSLITGLNSIKTEEVSGNIQLYPNPSTNGSFNLVLSDETEYPVVMQIISLNGQMVMTKKLTGQFNLVTTSGLRNGVYFLLISRNNIVEKMQFQIIN